MPSELAFAETAAEGLASGATSLVILPTGFGTHEVIRAFLRRVAAAPAGAAGLRVPSGEAAPAPAAERFGARLVLVLNTPVEESDVLREHLRDNNCTGGGDVTFLVEEGGGKGAGDDDDEGGGVADGAASGAADGADGGGDALAAFVVRRIRRLRRAQKPLQAAAGSLNRPKSLWVRTLKTSDPALREAMYVRGGVLFAPARSLVSDLLSGRLPPGIIDGVLVNHAEKVCQNRNSAFVLQLFRQQNAGGFLCGVSDAPEAFLRASTSLAKTLKAMYAARAEFFPRGHEAVALRSGLDALGPDTEELRVTVTAAVRDLQAAIVGALEKGYGKLRQNDLVDLSEISLDDLCCKPNIEYHLTEALGAVWGGLPPQYRRLTQDLAQFRRLLGALVQLDATQFYGYVLALAHSNTLDPTWLLTPEWCVILNVSKLRLYRFRRFAKGERGASDGPGPQPPGQLDFGLEVPPKWTALVNAIKAIPAEWLTEDRLRKLRAEAAVLRGDGRLRGDAPLRGDALTPPPPTSGETATAEGSAGEGESADAVAGGPAAGFSPPSPAAEVPSQAGDTPEYRVLILVRDSATAHRVSRVLQVGTKVAALEGFAAFARRETTRRLQKLNLPVDRDGFPACGPGASNAVLETALLSRAAARASELERRSFARPLHSVLQPEQFNAAVQAPLLAEGGWPVRPFFQILAAPGAAGALQLFLARFRPHHVLVFDPEIAFVRAVELYCAALGGGRGVAAGDGDAAGAAAGAGLAAGAGASFAYGGPDVAVSIFVQQDTVEQQAYLYALKLEADAWRSLGEQARFLVVPINERVTVNEQTFSELVAVGAGRSSRKAGGQKTRRAYEHCVVVDQRELRSQLPFEIYAAGIRVVPVTLLVGDYVLSRDIVIERKSPSDFVGSLASGRLFDQAQELCRLYRHPGLLLEFSLRASFSLHSKELLGHEKDNSALIQQLCVLVMTFPRLRIVWSPHPHFTVAVFKKLKEGREDPDPFTASVVGGELQAPPKAPPKAALAAAAPSRAFAAAPSTAFATAPVAAAAGAPAAFPEGGEKSPGPASGAPAAVPVSAAVAPRTIRHEASAKIAGVAVRAVLAVACGNTDAVDLIRKLPGVTHANLPLILRRVDSAAELLQMPLEQLQNLLGVANGTALYEFVTAEKGEA